MRFLAKAVSEIRGVAANPTSQTFETTAVLLEHAASSLRSDSLLVLYFDAIKIGRKFLRRISNRHRIVVTSSLLYFSPVDADGVEAIAASLALKLMCNPGYCLKIDPFGGHTGKDRKRVTTLAREEAWNQIAKLWIDTNNELLHFPTLFRWQQERCRA
jgi:hypothetical protein